MRGGRWSGPVAVVLVMVMTGASGCGGKKADARSGAGPTTTLASTDGDGHDDDGHDDADGHGHTSPTLVDPKTGKQGRIRDTDRYTAASPPPAGLRDPDLSVAEGDVPLQVEVAPRCVEHGQKLVARFKSQPGMTVAAQIKWPNDQFAGLDATRGTTGADGTLRWEVEVKPTALWGVADLQAAAIDETSDAGAKRSGSAGNWSFVVAPPGRC